jgi:hypothetical protein
MVTASLTVLPLCVGTACADDANVCEALLRPILRTSLDRPLRPYFVPRRPAWSGSEYRYSVRQFEPFCGGGAGCCTSVDGPCFGGCDTIPPESAYAFDPWEFEHLGQIPHDLLLDAVASPVTP